MDSLNIFIGYDPREAVAYHVCANSAIRHSSKPIVFHPLALTNLKSFYDERHNTKTGLTETEPTNQFIFSRFLTPYLMDYKGLALFVDGDMIFREDPAKLFEQHEWGKAVSVVKHNYKTKSPVKYLNQTNMDYERKNWSSVMLFDCGHLDCKKLTPEYVQNATGKQLHRLDWAKDEHIGMLPLEWNWLPDEYGENKRASLIHHTLGTPCFLDPEYSLAPMAAEWHREAQLTNFCLQTFVP
jgi:hypothetical protein